MSKQEILGVLRILYELALEVELPGLAAGLKANGIFEEGCRYWLDKLTEDMML